MSFIKIGNTAFNKYVINHVTISSNLNNIHGINIEYNEDCHLFITFESLEEAEKAFNDFTDKWCL